MQVVCRFRVSSRGMADEKTAMSTCTMPQTGTDPGLDLARWHQSQDREALERLMARSLDQAYTQARRTLGNAADAQDAVQEALVQIMRSAHRYDPARPFAPWLARHVHDACCRLRWRAWRGRARERAVAREGASLPETGVDAEAVRAAVAELGGNDRAAIELHYWAGLPQAEVARELGVSENALAVRLHRARERLRAILGRRGVAVGAAALVAALAPGQAWAAPPALVASAHALGTTAALPATTIPLGAGGTIAWHLLRHPWWSAAAAVLAGGLGLAAVAGQGDPPPPPRPRAEVPPPLTPPAPAADGAWAGPAREALRWFDAQAQVRVAADLGTLRRMAGSTRPLSLLADPQVQPLIRRLMATGPQQAELDAIRQGVLALAGGADGVVLSAGMSERILLAAPMPPALAAGLAGRIGATLGAAARAAPAGAGEPAWQVEGGGCIAFRGPVALLGPEAVLPTWRGPGPQADSPHPAPLWLEADLRGVVAAYAAADRERTDPIGIARLLGPGWRTCAPRLTATVAAEAGILVDELRIAGIGPCSPLDLAAMGAAARSGADWPLVVGALRLRRPEPRLTVARPADALLWAVAGFERPGLTALRPLVERSVPGAEAILPTLSGDVGMVVTPGIPFPAATLVLGLADRPDQALITRIAGGFGLTPAVPEPPALAAWQGFTPAGAVQVTLLADRLLVSSAADGGRGLAAGTAAEADLVVDADLPRIAATWGPAILSAIPGADLHELRSPQLLAKHLAPWHAAWTATTDGCVVRERGLSLAAACVGAAAIGLTVGKPEAETANARDTAAEVAAMVRHRDRLAAVAGAAGALTGEREPTQADCRALSGFFAGREPTVAEVQALGARYPAQEAADGETLHLDSLHARVVSSSGDRHVAVLIRALAPAGGDLRRQFISSVSVEALVWAAPLGDGWSIGIGSSGRSGLFQGQPPAPPPKAPEGRF